MPDHAQQSRASASAAAGPVRRGRAPQGVEGPAAGVGALQRMADAAPGTGRLRQLARAAGARGVVQRESSYDGVMPAHDVYQDDYAFDGGRGNKFTYHHIIPENVLKKVTAQLTEIRTHLAGNDAPGKDAFGGSLDTLTANGRSHWMNVRVQNFVFFANKEYSDLGVSVDDGEARAVMTAGGRDRDKLIAGFQTLFHGKISPKYPARHSAALGVKDALIKPMPDTQYATFEAGDPGTIAGLFAGLDAAMFDTGRIGGEVAEGIAEVNRNPPRRGSKKGGYLAVLKSEVRVRGVDDWFRHNFGAGVKKLVQDYGVPHDEDMELEHSVQWNPGNVHRGPSSTFRESVDELVDDGGDKFEKAAANIVGPDHYRALEALNGMIAPFLATHGPKKPGQPGYDAKIAAATGLVNQMVAVQGFGLTGFDEGQWEQHKPGKVRLRRDDDKLRGVGLLPPVPLDGAQENVVENV